MKFKRYFRWKRALRAGVFTTCLGVYLFLWGRFGPSELGFWGFLGLVVSCIGLDFIVKRILSSKKLKSFFYDSGGEL